MRRKIKTIQTVIRNILIVVGISLLLVIAIHTPVKVEKPETRMKAEVLMLQMAITQYRSTYKQFPIDIQTQDDYQTNTNNEFLLNKIYGENTREQVFIKGSKITEDKNKNPYQIILDTNWDHKIKLGDETIKDIVVIYGYGLNGKDEKGQGDDISTFK